MPRRPHIKLADLPQYVVQRGINRESCFFAEEDYHCYLHWLQKSAADWGCAIHAYVLMTNHVHLFVGHFRQAGECRQNDAIHRAVLCAIHQPQLSVHGQFVGGAC
jgi:putative transposase